jgi:hypothetical protein
MVNADISDLRSALQAAGRLQDAAPERNKGWSLRYLRSTLQEIAWGGQQPAQRCWCIAERR